MGRECPHCGEGYRWPLKATVDGFDVDICPSCRVPLDSPPGGDAIPVEGQIAAMAPPQPGREPAPFVSDNFNPDTAMKPLSPQKVEPIRDRARVAAAFVGLVGVAAAASLWADLSQLDLIDRALSGERVSFAEVNDTDDRVQTTAIIYTVVLILSAITFLLWYSRAYKNTIALGLSEPRFKTGWAVGYWFIPIVSLFRPKQVVDDIWRGSDPDLPRMTGLVGHRPVSPVIHLWWALWIISTFIANYATRIALNDEFPSAQELQNQSTAYVVVDVVDIVSAGLAIWVIVLITRRQQDRMARVEQMDAVAGAAPAPSAPPPPPPPSPPA